MTLRLTKQELARLLGVAGESPQPRKGRTGKITRKAPPTRQKPAQRVTGASAKESPGEAAFAAALRLHGADLPAPVRELVFVPGRKFRADFAWPDRRLLLEIDGGTYAPGGGRHAGDKDKEKANLAACLGYRVLHFSPQQVERDPAGCVELVRRALNTP